MKEGDQNTRFFHRVANSHHKNNSIQNLRVNGELTRDTETIKGCIMQFYQQLFTETNAYRPSLDGLDFSSISGASSCWLDRPFQEDEVFNVLIGVWGTSP